MAVEVRYEPPKLNPAVLIAAAAPAAATAGAEALLKAAEPLVPVDTGALVASGTVDSDAHSSTVSFSAVADDGYDYAAIQHERMDFHHERGQAKYLEQPLRADGPIVLAAIVSQLLTRL